MLITNKHCKDVDWCMHGKHMFLKKHYSFYYATLKQDTLMILKISLAFKFPQNCRSKIKQYYEPVKLQINITSLQIIIQVYLYRIEIGLMSASSTTSWIQRWWVNFKNCINVCNQIFLLNNAKREIYSTSQNIGSKALKHSISYTSLC